MKRVLILNGEGAALENIAIRSVLEYFGYIVTMYNIGRPQDYFDVFVGKQNFNYDCLIIGCHGDGGKIIVPILGENVYYPNECRNNIGYEELRGLVKIKDKTVICTGCTTGAGELYKEFKIIKAEANGLITILRYDNFISNIKRKEWLEKVITDEYQSNKSHPDYRFFLESRFSAIINHDGAF